jgi:CRP/FNR family transcriptional regulator, cyclic AMP receptor protein
MPMNSKRGLFLPEDPLSYLPRTAVREFAKNRVIYDRCRDAGRVYVVIRGHVKVVKTVDDGGQIVVRIVSTDGLFGEPVLIGGQGTTETAVALENVLAMSWTADEIEQQIEREPRLALALSQYLVRECIELQDRIESMAAYKTPERVMLALVQLADILGTSTPDGPTRISSLTHHTIAGYVGTSREIVTSQLNRLRRLGLLQYSRRQMDIHTQAMQEILARQGVGLPHTNKVLTYGAG